MPTSDELLRTEAAEFDYQVRVYVGGEYGFLDISGVEVGATYDPTASTTLSADLDPDDDEASVASTSGFTTGSFMVEPYSDDEFYEVIGYDPGQTISTKFDGLQRPNLGTLLYDTGSQDKSAIHSSGAAVKEWVDITSWVIGAIEIKGDYRSNIGSWTAKLDGHSFNSRILAKDRAILIMWRFRPASGDMSSWTDWTVAYLGFITRVSGRDDYRQQKTWSITARGSDFYIGETEVPAHKFGRVNLASGKTVTVSSVLEDPYLEIDSGEYQGYVSLGGENLTDGNTDTVWMSQDVPTAAEQTTYPTAMTINEVFLQAAPGREALQWIELYYENADPDIDNNLNYYGLVGADLTHWECSGGDKTIPDNNWMEPFKKGRTMDGGGSFAVYCSNKVEFERWFQLQEGYVLDWTEKVVGSFALGLLMGSVGLWNIGSVNLEDMVMWGGGGVPDYIGARETEGCNWFEGYENPWTGAKLAQPAAGNSLAKTSPGLLTDPSASAWTESSNPSPGGWQKQSEEYASVDLGALGCKLESELPASGQDYAEINDSTGLIEGAGYVMINAEIIGYDSIDHTTSPKQIVGIADKRGQGGTTPAVHPVDSVVKPYENGVAYDCPKISACRWRRAAALTTGGTPVAPKIWAWYISDNETVIYPDDGDWDDDWDLYWHQVCFFGWGRGSPSSPEMSEHLYEFEATRARHVMLVIHSMWDDGRARMNEIDVYSFKTESYSSDTELSQQLSDGLSSAVIKFMLTSYLGYPDSMITITDIGREMPEDLNTARTSGLQVFRDLLSRTGSALFFRRDGTVAHVFDHFYPLRTLPSAQITWDRDNAREVSHDRSPDYISQVVLRGTAMDGAGRVIEVRFPGKPLPLGAEYVVEDMVFKSATDALLLAEQIYLRETGPYTLDIVPVGPAEWVQLGERHVLSWELDEDNTIFSGRNFIVTSVSFKMDLGRASDPGRRQFNTRIGLEEMSF